MKILKCTYDPTKGLEGYDEKIGAIKDQIETFHQAMQKDGTSYLGFLGRGEEGLRLVSAGSLEELIRFVEGTTETEGYTSVHVVTINTKQ